MHRPVHHPVHNPVLLTSRPLLPPAGSGFVQKGMPQGHEEVILDRSRKRVEKEQGQSSSNFAERVKIMPLMQEAHHMIQAKHRREYANQFDEAELRAKIVKVSSALNNFDHQADQRSPPMSIPGLQMGNIASAVDTENQDFEEEQKGQQQLEFELQELREKKYFRQRAWMDQKKSLKQEIGRLQIKVNAITGLNFQSEIQKLLCDSADRKLGPDMEGTFSERAGTNIQFSEDGRIATRVAVMGNQALVFGSSPIRKDACGWYYSVEVKATTFLYGGLAIGVTQRRPSEFEKLSDTGRRLEDTRLVGYWANCVFVNKVQRKTHWDPATLCVGSKVGVLVTKEGDLKIFVDHMEVDCLKGVINVTPKLELYPVMDLYSTCKSLKLFF